MEVGDVVGRNLTVLAGPAPGETVVVGGMNKATAGAKVNPIFSNR